MEYTWPIHRIGDVTIHPGNGFFSGFRPSLQLEIISTDEVLDLIDIPWPAGQPMIELEDELRSVLRISR